MPAAPTHPDASPAGKSAVTSSTEQLAPAVYHPYYYGNQNYGNYGYASSGQPSPMPGNYGASTGDHCPVCKQYTVQKHWNVTALVLLVIAVVATLPLGMFALLCLPLAKEKRCTNPTCGHRQRTGGAIAIYVYFGLVCCAYLMAIIAIIITSAMSNDKSGGV